MHDVVLAGFLLAYTCLNPQPLLVLLPLFPYRLDQRETTTLIELLDPIEQVQRRHLAIVAKVQLGPLSPIENRSGPIRKVDTRIVSQRIVVEGPRPPPISGVHVGADARPLETEVDVDHVVHQEMPVAALVAP